MTRASPRDSTGGGYACAAAKGRGEEGVRARPAGITRVPGVQEVQREGREEREGREGLGRGGGAEGRKGGPFQRFLLRHFLFGGPSESGSRVFASSSRLIKLSVTATPGSRLGRFHPSICWSPDVYTYPGTRRRASSTYGPAARDPKRPPPPPGPPRWRLGADAEKDRGPGAAAECGSLAP